MIPGGLGERGDARPDCLAVLNGQAAEARRQSVQVRSGVSVLGASALMSLKVKWILYVCLNAYVSLIS